MKEIKIGKIVIFSLLISLPLLLQLLGVNLNVRNTENRKLKESPRFTFEQTRVSRGSLQKMLGVYRDVISFKNAYDHYYKDNFVFKNLLFKSYYFIQNDVFGVEPLAHKVVRGTNGWFFLGDSYSDVIKESKAMISFNEKELEQIKKSMLEKKAWLAKRNIDFYIAVAPNKHSVYGNELPIVKGNKITKLEQVNRLLTSEGLNFVDLSANFPGNNKFRLYHKTNTHWNDYGAYWAYNVLISKIVEKYPSLKVMKFNDFKVKTEISNQEDLTGMLDINVEEQCIILEHPSEIAQEVPSTLPIPPNIKDYVFHYTSTINSIKVLTFRDSFFSALMKFTKESFGESVYVWSLFDKNVVEAEKPNIVIWEIVERDLDHFLL